ncbi:hypothetical protein ACQPWY_23585 [Pseudonocardia xinjiangensis]|uniref:hypothetical protein n=1 Tax=Pseudonocardia xinjiangensis TaxID=75289 RepID=UPI003D8DA548
MSVGDRHAQLQVVSLGSGRAGMVSPETLAQLTGAPEPHVIWVRAAPGMDSLQLVDDLDGLADAAGAEVEDALQARAAGEGQLDLLTWSVLGLLGISVAIALIGIANTSRLRDVREAGPHLRHDAHPLAVTRRRRPHRRTCRTPRRCPAGAPGRPRDSRRRAVPRLTPL